MTSEQQKVLTYLEEGKKLFIKNYGSLDNAFQDICVILIAHMLQREYERKEKK